MRKITSMYVLFFLTDSIAYLLIDTLKEKLEGGDALSVKNYVAFVVVAALSVVSIFAYWIGAIITRRIKKKPKVYFVIVLTLIIVASMLADMYLLLMMTDIIELHANLLDHFLLAGLCQITLAGILSDPKT